MSILTHVITQAVEAIAKNHLSKAANNKVTADWQKEFTLRMQKAYNIAGWVCIGIASTCFLLPVIEQPDKDYWFAVLPFFLLFFGGFGLLFLLCYRNHQVVYNDTYIVVSTPLGRKKTSTWKKIVKTRFNSTSGFLTLIDEDGQRLRVNQHLIGLNEFIRQLQIKTGLYVDPLA